MRTQKLPIGIENFEEMQKQDFYYVDKTGLIVDLLAGWGKVNLFTRPRRFGKTLNMSMLKCLCPPPRSSFQADEGIPHPYAR